MFELIPYAASIIFVPAACLMFLFLGIVLIVNSVEAIHEKYRNNQSRTNYKISEIIIVLSLSILATELGLYGTIWILAKCLIH